MNKETALNMIDSRIRGIDGTIIWHDIVVAEFERSKTMAHHDNYEPYPIDRESLAREKARLEAARKDVMKRAN